MIFYFDGPNINFINSIIEYDLMKKVPPEYTLNLLTSDNKSENDNSSESLNQKDNSQSSNFNVNNIQRELINLLSYDFEKDEENDDEFEDKSITDSIKNTTNKDGNNKNYLSMEDEKYMNSPLFNNGINYSLNNINNPININTNFPERINSQLYNNLNENIGSNIGVNIGENMGDKINNNFLYNNNNNGMNFNINEKIWNYNNHYYNNFFNSSLNGINNQIPFNINNSINNINNSRIINRNSIKDSNNKNNDDINIINNLFNKNKAQQFNIESEPYKNSPSNIQNQHISINNDYDNNHFNYINNVKVDNLQKFGKPNNNIYNIHNNNINNINYINNFNYIHQMNDCSQLTNINNIYNIKNVSNNNSNNKSFCVKDNKYLNMSLSEITSKLDIIAKKQPGCRFLENLIKTNENSFEIINKIFYPKLYWVKLYELCNDLFGNYFIQTIIPQLNTNNMISFSNLINNNLLKLCLNPHGTRVVQAFIENIKDNRNNLLVTFTNYLSKIMDKLIIDLNGSFVLIHYAKEIKDNNIIYNFLNNNIIDVCTKPYSCSALQKFIDLGTNMQKLLLINSIINNTHYLIGSQCGLYVLQFIMDKKNYAINDRILNTFINNVIKLSKQKYSSNVIEKCLETCSPKMVNNLIEILNNEEVIRDLIKNMFGNYVIQKLLIVCPDEDIRSHILTILASEFSALSSLPFGHKLIKKLIMTYPEIKYKL